MAMFKHLLVPLDGSRLAETALPAASYLARAMGANVTLLHIVERDAPEEIHGERHLTAAGEAKHYLEETAARAFTGIASVDCRIEAGGSSQVARRIEEYASSSGSDLIVMCTHGRSGLRHLFSGSNAQQVIACGRIPVLQVRPTGEIPPEFAVRKILVPLDGKPEHEQGLEVSALLTRIFDAELHILIVVPTRRTMRGESAIAAKLSPRAAAALLDISLKEAEQYLCRRVESLRGEGLRVSGQIDRGDAADAILRLTGLHKMDLIVVGTHRKSGADAFWSGSVAPKVTNHSTVPVLLIPLQELAESGSQ